MNVLSVASGLVEDIFIVFDGVFPTPSNHTKPNANDTLVTKTITKADAGTNKNHLKRSGTTKITCSSVSSMNSNTRIHFNFFYYTAS